jgi:hypothetical protein
MTQSVTFVAPLSNRRTGFSAGFAFLTADSDKKKAETLVFL